MGETILLVDDEDGIRKVLGISLRDAGYEVLTAANGEEALSVFRAKKPAMVLTDIKMPGMDGIELLQRIKRESADTEVIMLTGHGDLDLAIRSLQCEAADFVTKPISDEVLEIALKRAHERMWMRRKLQEYTESLEAMVHEKTHQLLQTERLAAIGQTVTTLAHAIKNIISGLSGGMFVLQKGMELDNEQYRDQGWEMLKGNVGKVKNLVLGLLTYAKDREPDFKLCDPNEPVKEVYHLMLSRANDCGVTLRMELASNLDYTLLDPEGIHSCLLNLVTNALDACLDIDCVNQTLEVAIRSLKVDGWAVEYQVADNGCGMDEATRQQVFNNFFSTKGSRGTGLGLMITRKVITEHGGAIELTSEKGKGTTFFIRLPKRYDIASSKMQCL
jgi:signal transduction histidine kinase